MRFNLDRGMWPEAGLAAFATLSVAWPLTELLREGSWIGPAILMVLLVGGVGSLLRSLDLDPTLIVLSQAFAAAVALLWQFLRDTLVYGIFPWSETLDQTTELLREAGSTLRTYAAPAPTHDGVEFLIVAVLTLTAISVDSIGVTGRAPATAGIPLAAAFLVSVSNSGQAMEPWFFAAAALGWLLMVAQQGNRLVTGWSSADRRESVGSHDVSFGPTGHRRTARVLAIVTVLGALVAASALPHLPPTFFTEGLARNADGRSLGGNGSVSFTETMDVTADLHNRSDEPVLTYRSQELLQEPLRVTATSEFDGERWVPPDYDPAAPVEGSLNPYPGNAPPGVADSVPREFSEVAFLSNGLRPPHLAVPGPVSEVTADAQMRWDPRTAAVRVQDRVDSYDVTFMRLAPGGADDLPDGVGEAEADPDEFAQYLQASPNGRETYGALSDEIVGEETNDLVVGQLLQQHFRSGIYTYNLQLAPGPSDSQPIEHFLTTQQGYCVQFATAMVMMARHQGIPARMAVGFLPGEREPDGTWTVIASRAHTWPELWVDGMGWVRFDPTPGVRSGQPPAYTELNQNTAEADPTLTSSATPTGEPTQAPDDSAGEDSWWDSTVDALRSSAPILLRGLAVVLVLGLLMALVAIAGRRHREAVLRHADTPQERIEGQWELLKRSLQDYGIDPPPDKSPREMGAHYADRAHLGRRADEALGRATATLERARYAPAAHTETSDDATMHRDVVSVLDSVAADLPWNIRASAKLFPRSGVQYIRSIIRSWFPFRT
ncbi:transglutaminaseTgpA domain-containing protein [Ornithinimicrobium murale]|uniref:transglutaminase family protein n=1 Tax=Ornithinimicrobium murale TaxID=1050153 RepID=UPI000E0D4464|nr:DUF3488 and transglutaminase-like domain-containing protein [Ornithinimicrobium murale]